MGGFEEESSSGGSQNLAQVLAVGNDTGNQQMYSSDGVTNIEFQDGYVNIQAESSAKSAQIQADATLQASMAFNNGAGKNGDSVINEDTNTVRHTDKIVLNAPRVNISSIPTSPAGLSSGDIWSNLGVLSIV